MSSPVPPHSIAPSAEASSRSTGPDSTVDTARLFRPAALPDRLPIAVTGSAAAQTQAPAKDDGLEVRRIERAGLPQVMDLFRARVRWMAARGIVQWLDSQAAEVAARLDRQARAGGLFGLFAIAGSDRGGRRRSAEAPLAVAALDAEGPLWTAHPHRHQEPVCHLEKLMTSPAGASAGCGGMLLMALESALMAAGCGLLRLDCMAGSLPLRRFWQTRGYLPVGSARLADGTELLLHEKRLRPLPMPGLRVAMLAPEMLDAAAFPDAVRATLLFVIRGGRILLIDKKRGHGAGNINGPGGKLDPGETPRECAIREVREELRIEVPEPRFVGELRFQETDGSRIHGFVFRAGRYRGTPEETDEAVPHWFDVDAIPFDRMWLDDRMWLPWVLAGESFRAAFLTHGAGIEQARLQLGRWPEPDGR